MARNGRVQVITENTQGEDGLSEEAQENTKEIIAIGVPHELKVLIESDATNKKVSMSRCVLEIVAEHFKYTGELGNTKARGKYAGMSDEEKETAKKAAAKEANAKRTEQIKLIRQLTKSKTLDEAVKALMASLGKPDETD